MEDQGKDRLITIKKVDLFRDKKKERHGRVSNEPKVEIGVRIERRRSSKQVLSLRNTYPIYENEEVYFVFSSQNENGRL